jgi:hypothetical protein
VDQVTEIDNLKARVESLEAIVAELLTKAPKAKTAGVTTKTLTDAGMSESVASDLLIHRRHIKAPLTMTALSGIQREASKARLSLDQAATLMMNRGWRGFDATWVKPSDMPNQASAESAFLNRLRGGDESPRL